jgi:HAD superfamily hydrolase (TIGR01549 family)
VSSCPEVTFQEILKAHGVTESIDRVKEALAKGNKEFNIEQHTHLPAHDFYTEWNLVHLKHLGLELSTSRKLAEDLDFEWFQFAQLQVYPDVKQTLRKLREMKFKLGVIKGGYEDDIEKILPLAGLHEFFDVCVGVDTIGKKKPDKTVFEYALRQLKVEPSEAIFVGDDLEADYYGAEGAGLFPVLIKREGSTVPNVRTIRGLDGVFEVLRKISA